MWKLSDISDIVSAGFAYIDATTPSPIQTPAEPPANKKKKTQKKESPVLAVAFACIDEPTPSPIPTPANKKQKTTKATKKTKNKKQGSKKTKNKKQGCKPKTTLTNMPPIRNNANPTPLLEKVAPPAAQVIIPEETLASPVIGNAVGSMDEEALSDEPIVLPGKDIVRLMDCVQACCICQNNFEDDVLANKEAVILPCGRHDRHALCCSCVYKLKVQYDTDRKHGQSEPFKCPMCKTCINPGWTQAVAEMIILLDINVQEKLEYLSLTDEDATKLLWSNEWDVSLVHKCLKEMSGTELSSKQKQEIFEKVNLVVRNLQNKLDDLNAQIRKLELGQNGKSKEQNREQLGMLLRQQNRLKKQMHVARETAADECFRKINPDTGVPGASKLYVVDFHGQKVNEIPSLFRKKVKPFVDAGYEVRIITGRGKHSNNGKAQIRNKLTGWLSGDSSNNCYAWRSPDNPGAIDVFLKPAIGKRVG